MMTSVAWADSIKKFRTRQGISTNIMTTEEIGGNTTSAIESFINDAYANWQEPPAAVLLMADYGSSGSSITSQFIITIAFQITFMQMWIMTTCLISFLQE